MPKRTRVPPVIRPGSRKPSTRWDEERRSQLLVIALGAAVVAAVALIAIFGYYQTHVRPKGETVLQVGSRSFNLDYLERRLRYDIRQGNTTYQANSSQAATLLLNEIEVEELTRQGAPEKGVDISDETIDAEIRRRENVPDDADRNTFAVAYRKAVRDSGLSTEGYRDVIAAGIAQNAIQSIFQDQAPKTADQVRFRVIVLTTEDDAKAALDRLHNGEDFATVASEVSKDTASRDKGGEQDWTPRGILDPPLDAGPVLAGGRPDQRHHHRPERALHRPGAGEAGAARHDGRPAGRSGEPGGTGVAHPASGQRGGGHLAERRPAQRYPQSAADRG